MPQLGETVTEGTITRWMKAVGDQVERDEPLFEVSTDKVDSEVPSPAAGILSEILVPEGETVEVGVRLAVIGDGASPAEGPRGGAPTPPRRSRQAGTEPGRTPCCSRPWCGSCCRRTGSASPRSPGRASGDASPAMTRCG